MLFSNEEKRDEYLAHFLLKTIKIISKFYYREVSQEDLYRAAVQGMVDALDQYSAYLSSDGKAVKEKDFKEAGIDVKKIMTKNKNVIIIQFHAINQRTVMEIQEVLQVYDRGSINGVILDLRDNIGGNVECAAAICRMFVREGVIFTGKNKNDSDISYMSELLKKPYNDILVLVNSGTKSSAEAIAAALQDDGNIVIGKSTYGKGISQSIFPVLGGALKLSVNEFYRRSGEKLNEVGVIPDIIILDDDLEKDKILETALRQILK